MKPKTLAIALTVFISLVVIITVILFAIIPSKTDSTNSVAPTIQFSDSDVSVIGYVFSSGLQTGPQYQLTYINYEASNITPVSLKMMIDGVFLTGQNKDFTPYWGKCVIATGSLPAEINTTNPSENYYRANMQVTSIALSDNCSVILDEHTDAAISTGTYTGIILSNKRPAPDIAYDYKLVLTTPYKTTNTASGLEELVSEIIIVPMNNGAFMEIEQNLGRKVTVDGEWMTGFAESTFFLVNSVYENYE